MARTRYTSELADEICEEIAKGGALYLMCQEKENWPDESTIYRWIDANDDFREKYARARERQADRRNEEIIVIADTATDANLARLQIDARKWQASKLAPKKYGDRTQVDATVTHSWAQFVEEVAAKRLEAAKTIEGEIVGETENKD